MATAPNTTAAHRRWQRLRTITATAAASAVMALAACTSTGEGTVTDTPSPTPTPSESPTPDPVFALEIPEDICPTAEVIPEELAAPEDVGYTTEFGPHENGVYPFQKCAYTFNGELTSLDGIQAVQNIIIEFYSTDDLSFDLFHPSDYSQVDFEKVETAEYFRDWDQAVDKSKDDLNSTWGYGLEESEYISFEALTSRDNLYVYSSILLVMTDEGPGTDFDLAIDIAAYQILEAIVAPVVADLERQ